MIARAHLAEMAANDVLGHRPRLFGLAYRMLGDVDESEDVVQEAYLRWYREDRSDVRSSEAWLVSVVSRLSVDRLRRLRTERATYPGPWLPEPIATDVSIAPSAAASPERNAELASDLSVALLVLLERLAPEERAGFLLREVFGMDYEEIARTLQRRPDAVRQMVHRARERVQGERPRVATSPKQHEEILERFLCALKADDADAVLELLAPNVVLATDGGGRAAAVRNWVRGPERVARLMLGVGRKFWPSYSQRIARINGRPALLTFSGAALNGVTMIDVEDGRISSVFITRNPDKLRHALQAVGPII